tara:strand:- start:2214 stop:2519 length:306 start_codon:yes stop_codon:yes gene_type:complete
MGEIATRLADQVWITSDNPRSEDARSIIADIQTGVMDAGRVATIEDRKDAILAALEQARDGDLILIAGKGHEDYQLVGDQKLSFSDRSVVEEWIQAENGGS